jgi:uncharacterized protein YndB with AHSA1/START domain
MADWLMPNDFTPELGHCFQFRTKPVPGFDSIVNCKVLEINPPRKLVLSWRGGPLDTTVSFNWKRSREGHDYGLPTPDLARRRERSA